MVNTRKKGLLLAFLLAVGFLLAVPVVNAFAALPSGWTLDGQTVVSYRNDNAGKCDHLYIYDDNNELDAFCLNRSLGMDNGGDFAKRTLYDAASDTYTYTDSNGNQQTVNTPVLVGHFLVNKDKPSPDGVLDWAADNPAAVSYMKKALYYGYVGQAANLGVTGNDLYDVTQDAVWQISHFGRAWANGSVASRTGGSDFEHGNLTAVDKLLTEYVFNDNVAAPDGILIVGHGPNTATGQGQHVVSFIPESMPDNPTEVTVKISKVEVNGTEELPGAKLEISSDVEGFETISWTSTTEQKEVTLKPGKYTLTETTAPDGYEVAESIDFEVTTDGKVTVGGTEQEGNVVKMEDKPSSSDDNGGGENGNNPNDDGTPKIGTTVHVDGSTAASGAVLNMDNGAEVPVVDTIAYSGLKADTDYTVEGQLMKIVNGQASDTGISMTQTVKSSAEGEGTWDINFGNAKLEDDTYYVVFESAFEGTDTSGTPVADHKDANDLPQAVNVGKGWEESGLFDKEPTFTPVYENSVPYLATTVKAGDKSGSDDAEATLTYDEASKITTVTDTIAYSNFKPGESYTITGTLYASKDNKTFTAIKDAVAVQTASDTGFGEWEMTFTGVTLEAGTKYVVAERAVSADGSLDIEHKDFTDKAQTIIVGPKPASAAATGASSTAKTGDEAGTVVIGALFAALAAAGLALGARRKLEK